MAWANFAQISLSDRNSTGCVNFDLEFKFNHIDFAEDEKW